MKKYVVSLLAFLFLLALQPLYAEAGHTGRVGFTSRSFAVGLAPRRFVSPLVIVVNPGRSHFACINSFAREVIILPRHHFVGNEVIVVPRHRFAGNTIIREPFFCFAHGIGFTDEASFFEHLHQFHGLAFETIPSAVVHNGPQVFFFGD